MILQRNLVGLRLRMADDELVTKYTFPFVDAEWKVSFVVVDLLGRGPRVLRGSIRRESGLLVTENRDADLAAVESVPEGAFEKLVHYDPWWDFRGVSGVRREWIRAVLATNIARPFERNGRIHKVHDLEMSDGMEVLDAVIVKDDRFAKVRFQKGDIDLLSLRPADRRAPA